MELWAAGFNAWNQLQFDRPHADEPDDLHAFTRVLRGDDIERPVAKLARTLVKADGQIRVFGAESGELAGRDPEEEYGRLQAPNGAVIDPRDGGRDDSAALAASTLESQLHRHRDRRASRHKLVAAYETGFAVLAEDGRVYTMGDERYSACLGRDISTAAPASGLYPVQGTDDLPGGAIVKVVAGGYMLGALTESGDLYCWGGGPGGPTALREVSGQPEAVKPPGGMDIQDVAIGDAHIIVLTRDGRVFVRGGNTNGQLGLGAEAEGRVDEWTEVHVALSAGHHVFAIEAGPRASFILVRRPE